jgi:transcriptional regulator with XRE-family HTH domain
VNPVPKRNNVSGSSSDLQIWFGALIRKCRHDLGITQEELAWRADMHRTYLADVERGARNVTLRTVANLAKALHVSIENLFAHDAKAHGAPLQAEQAPADVRDILLVEHNASDAAATVRALKRAGLSFQPRVVRDGKAGLEYLFGTGRYSKARPARPQLILLNPKLPGMQGPEFLQRIRSDARTRDIPVAVLRAPR